MCEFQPFIRIVGDVCVAEVLEPDSGCRVIGNHFEYSPEYGVAHVFKWLANRGFSNEVIAVTMEDCYGRVSRLGGSVYA